MKIRHILLTATIGLLAISGQAQSFESREKVYRMALQNNDLTVATQAVYDILALDNKHDNWKDTLAMLYFQRGGFDQCRRISGSVLESHPDNIGMLELKAVSEQSIGFFKEALVSYEKLYKETKNIFHLYEIATIHYTLKQYDDAEKVISQLLSDPAIENEKINLSIGANQTQDALLRAAVYNLQGVVALEKGDSDRAKQSFNAASKLDPEFVLPKNNLEFIGKLEAEKQEKKEEPKAGKSGK